MFNFLAIIIAFEKKYAMILYYKLVTKYSQSKYRYASPKYYANT